MKKLLSLFVLLTCVVSLSFAKSVKQPVIAISSTYSTTTIGTGTTSVSPQKFLQDPHVYIFLTTCGFGSVTMPGELSGKQWVAMWATFELLCHMPDAEE
ncbi:hypothetical protein SAMN05216464_11080 [Mucilaginibacter pineti]|uniref:Uncharacterized protein n=1 Tax=Mucilaginibacter pineti TaxID=1391627 RepID=A0A1G7GCH2_9SPHI|nr:hypothetical protein [Mucilaginibacter pineti]SDE85852.1 hypothetical protein SAMN05216464_11080 [Mucilaginibacter pineti]